MRESIRGTVGTAASEPAELKAAALDAAEALHRLLEQASIYPPGHPIIERTRDDAVARIDRSMQMRSPLELRVEPESVSIHSTRFESARCRSLGKMLFDLEIVSIELQEDVLPEEILPLAQEIARFRSMDRTTRLVKFEPPPLPHVRVTLMDYGAFRFTRGARDGALAETPEALWDLISQTILEARGGPDALSPEELGHLIGEEIDRMEDVGAGILTRELRRLVEGVEHLPPEARRDAEGRMNRLLASLPSSLRTDLLRIELRASSILESPFAGRLRSSAVMTSILALLEAVRCGERPPQDALALVNQLLRVSSLPPAVRDSLEATAGAAGSGSHDLRGLEESIREIFLNRDELEANPADYQELIEFLAVKDAAPAEGLAVSWRDHFGDPSDGEVTRVQALRIAIEQLHRPPPVISPLGGLSYLSEATTELIERERFDVLADALTAAEACARASGGDVSVRRAVQDYVNDVLHPSRIAAMLASLGDKDQVSEAAAELLRRAGVAGLESILATLASGPSPAVTAALHDIVRTYPPRTLLKLTEERLADGWSAVRHLFPVLQHLPDPEVTDFLLRMLGHPEDLLRCEALSGLVARELPASVRERALIRALGDPSPNVIRIALHGLRQAATAASVNAIGLLIEGRLVHRSAADVSVRLRAARELTRHQDPGWRRLSRAFGRLAWSFRRSDSLVARGVATMIRGRRDSAAVLRMLRLWHWSLARLLSVGGGS